MASMGDTEVKPVESISNRTKKWDFGFLIHGLRKKVKYPMKVGKYVFVGQAC